MNLDELLLKLNEIHQAARAKYEKALSAEELYDAKVRYQGKNGVLTQLMKETGRLPAEAKPLWGQRVNAVKNDLDALYQQRENEVESLRLKKLMQEQTWDFALPGPKPAVGSYHVLSVVTSRIVKIMERLGYSLRLGPLIETDFYNFQALNIPEDHPARDMQDTFFVDDRYVLRTHTSPIQIHALETESLPLRVIGTGAVFRCDHDVSHLPHFHQVEALLVDEKISMADLKGTISYFVRSFFEKDLKVRFRPSYFPFTEPSAEVDCQCPICQGKGCSLCKGTGWIEIGGCGLVNPRVFEQVKIDPKKWQGFAFGFGIERMAMILYRIDDIRLFPENDPRFLRQFESLTL